MAILIYLIKRNSNLLFVVTLLSLIGLNLRPVHAQGKMIDQIIAVIGNDMITQSDIENQVMQYKMENYYSDNMYCNVFEQFLIQKLLLNQAKVDSITVKPAQVDAELDRRLKYFIEQFGSRKKLEEYYQKSIIQIKEDLRSAIEEQLLAQTMQNNIIGEIKVTPSEVKKYYSDLPKDSLPFIESEYEVRQIVLKPPYPEEAILEVRQRLLDMRKQILEGKSSFAVLAALYSEDKGSALNGGELGLMNKADFVAAFADAAFKLKEGQISNIVQTEYGYHIIQLIAKEEDRVNVRHILLRPKITPQIRNKVLSRLDSISNAIRIDSITYEKAALKFSQDNDTKANGGLMVNQKTSNAKFKINDFNKTDYFVIKDLKVGDISKPYESIDDKGNTIFKIVLVQSKTNPHSANLKDDYDIIQEMAKNYKQQEIIKNWIEDKQKKTYIHIDKSFTNCEFESTGWLK